MKRFLINLAIFLVVVFVLAYGVDYIVSKGLSKTQRNHFFMMNALMNDTIDADIIILGNSRAGGYDPRVIDSLLGTNTWNLWCSGQHFGVEYLRYQLYKRKNKKPQLVILNIGMAELGYVHYGLEREQYYPYINDPMLEPYLKAYGYNWLDLHVPMYRYRWDHKMIFTGILEYFNVYHDTKGNYIRGYAVCNEEWDRTAFEEIKKTGVVHDMHDSVAINLLNTFLAELKQDTIPIVFVQAPMFYELKDWLDLDSTMMVYHSFSKTYNIHLLDYSDMTICKDSTYFKDTNHLNERGSKLFTIQLTRDIDSLGLIR